MNKFFALIYILLNCVFFSCSVTNTYVPSKNYSQQSLQKDYLVLKNILEEKHPSLYWYRTKDSMDYFFHKYYAAITDSMNEQQFVWQVLSPLVDKIHCGHTSVSMSLAYSKWAENKRFPSFPLFLKVWNDTMAVTGNLNRKDSIFKRGTLITSINGNFNHKIIEEMFGYLPEDGYANNINYIRLSANFPYLHRNIYGISKKYTVSYIDSMGIEKTDTLPAYFVQKDSTKKDSLTKVERRNLPKIKRILQYRSLEIDSSGKFAVMTLNSFDKGRLRSFFRKSFKKLKNEKIDNLVLDIRSNGGGKVELSTLLTKYISRRPFKVADSVFSKAGSLGRYTKYIKGKWFNNIELFFITRKKKDGLYHIGKLEKKLYKPKRNNHFNADVFVITNGPTFSAASLFCNLIKGQPGVTLIGEETGGGWYGNNGIMIPDIKLPNTKARVRLPLFRIVQYKHVEIKGTGIPPDIYIPTNYEALLKGYDKKMKVVKGLIYDKVKSK